MEKLTKYQIPFIGLNNGVHNFDYTINGSFFENFDHSPIRDCHIKVKLLFDKRESFFILIFKINGNVTTECDRCLEPVNFRIVNNYKVIVKFDDIENISREEEIDIIFISRADRHFDVSQLIYEFINLSMPIKKVHPNQPGMPDGCNPQFIAALDNFSPKEPKVADPRWRQLAKLKIEQ